MREKREIARECYIVIGTVIADVKSRKEVYTAIADFAKSHGLTTEELTKYVDNFYYGRLKIKNLPDMLEEVHNAFSSLKQDKAKKDIPELESHELSKEEKAEIIRNNRLKAIYSKYFNALINAYNRLLPLDTALEEVEEETKLSSADIKRYGEIYLINYASAYEKNIYRQKLERYKKTLENPTANFLARVNVLEINKIINNDLASQDSKENNLEDEFIIHLHKVEEYEREYLEEILDTMCYCLQNGIPVPGDENTKRNFTIIDYYSLTSYPLEKLKLRAVNLNLLSNNNDRKLFMTFVTQNSQKGSYVLNINLQSILNDLEITKQFGSTYRKLTSDEKIAIYYLLKERKIPMTFENFNVAVSEYAHNRLFLARR